MSPSCVEAHALEASGDGAVLGVGERLRIEEGDLQLAARDAAILLEHACARARSSWRSWGRRRRASWRSRRFTSIGSSMARSALRVPSEIVKRWSLVRSSLASRSALEAIRLTARRMIAPSAIAAQASMTPVDAGDGSRRAIEGARLLCTGLRHDELTLGGLALVDDDLVGEQGEQDQRDVEDEGRQIENAARDVLEVRQEAERARSPK